MPFLTNNESDYFFKHMYNSRFKTKESLQTLQQKQFLFLHGYLNGSFYYIGCTIYHRRSSLPFIKEQALNNARVSLTHLLILSLHNFLFLRWIESRGGQILLFQDRTYAQYSLFLAGGSVLFPAISQSQVTQ